MSQDCTGALWQEEHFPECYVSFAAALRLECSTGTPFPSISLADCTPLNGTTVRSCQLCGQVPSLPLDLLQGCLNRTTHSNLFLECYDQIPCGRSEWGASCSCNVASDYCTVSSAELTLTAPARVPAAEFTLIGNLSLASIFGLSMNVSDKVLVKGRFEVTGTLVVLNVNQSGLYRLMELLPAEATSPAIVGTFQSVVVQTSNSSCVATGQPVYDSTGVSVLVSVQCGSEGLAWYVYLGIAIGVVIAGVLVAVGVVLLYNHQKATFEAKARKEIQLREVGS